jgi:hypothetical protein
VAPEVRRYLDKGVLPAAQVVYINGLNSASLTRSTHPSM